MKSGEVFEFSYADSRYRFVRPNIPQRSFDIISTEGVFYEHLLLKDMKQRVRPGDLVVDVGANIGNHSIFLAGICDCDVLALEPFHTSFEDLIKNIEINNLRNRVTPIKMAAGAKVGYGRVCLPTTANYGEVQIKETTSPTDIRVVPLDALELRQQPRVLKIDVEDGEMEVLRGAECLIRSARPLIYVETRSTSKFDEVCGFLHEMNYHVSNFFQQPATFLFASAEEGLTSSSYDPESQLGHWCLRYRTERDKARAERDEANTKVRKLKDTLWKKLKKKTKGKSREVRALLGLRTKVHGLARALVLRRLS